MRLELAGREAIPLVPPRVHPTWMRAELEHVLPGTGRERRAEIRGRAKLNSLLEGQ